MQSFSVPAGCLQVLLLIPGLGEVSLGLRDVLELVDNVSAFVTVIQAVLDHIFEGNRFRPSEDAITDVFSPSYRLLLAKFDLPELHLLEVERL